MSNTGSNFELVDLFSLEEYQRGDDNSERLERLKKYLPIAISELTEGQRKLIYSYYYEGKNQVEIAAELGVNRSTVCRSLLRAKKRLQNRLKYCL